CCRVMMPDPSHYAELLRESFAELEVGPVAARKKRKGKTGGRKTARKKKTARKASSAKPVTKSASAAGSESAQLK
ncbi:MAG: hypothetical protein OEM60_01960, partial [Gammaproteobacteria bacterium]|nr:hypothetical protein [Gammaproteobacteria bacterium]